MIQLIFHLIGDYITQNNWMATNKVKMTAKGWLACLIHCFLYTVPFAWYFHSLPVTVVIFGSHFLMDKFRLAVYVIRLKNWEWKAPFGFPDGTPPFMSIWLMIIVDSINKYY